MNKTSGEIKKEKINAKRRFGGGKGLSVSGVIGNIFLHSSFECVSRNLLAK